MYGKLQRFDRGLYWSFPAQSGVRSCFEYGNFSGHSYRSSARLVGLSCACGTTNPAIVRAAQWCAAASSSRGSCTMVASDIPDGRARASYSRSSCIPSYTSRLALNDAVDDIYYSPRHIRREHWPDAVGCPVTLYRSRGTAPIYICVAGADRRPVFLPVPYAPCPCFTSPVVRVTPRHGPPYRVFTPGFGLTSRNPN